MTDNQLFSAAPPSLYNNFCSDLLRPVLASYLAAFNRLPIEAKSKNLAATIWHSTSQALLIHEHYTDQDAALPNKLAMPRDGSFRFIYANSAALLIFGRTWGGQPDSSMIGLDSRLSAAPAEQEHRNQLFAAMRDHGFFEGYEGRRLHSGGASFAIKADVWAVGIEGRPRIEAATFKTRSV